MSRRTHIRLGDMQLTGARAAPPRPLASTPPTPARQSRYVGAYRRPQCTHTTMNRAHGVACSMCGRVPDHGWVYQCRQDHQPHKDRALPDIDSLPTVPDDSDYFDAKARVAEHLKMSPSIVNAIRAGDYDVDQVDKLIVQRENVIHAIREQEGGSKENIPPATFDGIITSAGTTYSSCRAGTLLPQSGPANRKDSMQPPAQVTCNFAICAACRPYFSDRLWASFESTWAEKTTINIADTQTLRLMDPSIARTIGLRPSPPVPFRAMPSHQTIDITDVEGESEISVDWSATNSGESESDGSETADKTGHFPCPGPLHCPVWSRNSGCAYENGGYDDGKRAENHGFIANGMTPENSLSQLSHYTYLASSTPGACSTTASSVSLQSTPTAPLIPLSPTEDTFDEALEKELTKTNNIDPATSKVGGRRRKTEIGVRYKNSNDSMDSKGEAEGGVVLTH